MGVAMRPDGYCRVDEVLAVKEMQIINALFNEIHRIVAESDKQRFSLAYLDAEWWIRANQGHSIKLVEDKLLLRQLVLGREFPPVCIHGTYLKHWPSIKQKGLLAGGVKGQSFRNHIHFAPGEPGAGTVISGMRGSCEVAVYLDLPLALQAGLSVYMSSNSVILSPGFSGVVPVDLFEKVVNLKTGAVIWPET